MSGNDSWLVDVRVLAVEYVPVHGSIPRKGLLPRFRSRPKMVRRAIDSLVADGYLIETADGYLIETPDGYVANVTRLIAERDERARGNR